MIPWRKNLDILPGASGMPSLAALPARKRSVLLQGLQALQDYDYLLIDNSPGITPTVLSFCLSSREIVIVLTPEATSIADAYALLKSLHQSGLQYPPFIILNKMRTSNQAQQIWNRLRGLCRTSLQLPLMFLGLVPLHTGFDQELLQQKPLVQISPASPAAAGFWNMARRLVNRPRQNVFHLKIDQFWNQALLHFAERSSGQPQQWSFAEQQPPSPQARLQRVQDDVQALLQSDLSPEEEQQLAETIRTLLQDLEQDTHSWHVDKQRQPARYTIGLCLPEDELREILFDFLSYLTRFQAREIKDAGLQAGSISALICSQQGLAELVHNRYSFNSDPVPLLLLDSWGRSPLPAELPSWLELQQILQPPYDLQELRQALQEILP